VEGFHIRNDKDNISKAILEPLGNEVRFMESQGLISRVNSKDE
jgi:hypothetical protein